MKQFLLSVSLLIGAATNAQDCSELFISEYVEGWSNNKALEIYNPTSESIDLSAYVLIRYSNGATSAGQGQSVQLNGTIGAYDTYVAVIDKRDSTGTGQEAPVWEELDNKADGFYCPDYNTSNAMYFNGNDAVVLAKGDYTNPSQAQVVDIFGKIGEDPDNGECDPDEYGTCGWTTAFPFVPPAGEVVTTDHSLIRKKDVLKGETDPSISHFDALKYWDSIPPVITDEGTGNLVGNWSSLGSHECDCETLSTKENKIASTISIYPNPSDDGNFTLTTDKGIAELHVFNSIGQEVLTETHLPKTANIKINSQPGLYLMNVITEDGLVSSRRIILK